jgi:hypothetical protein
MVADYGNRIIKEIDRNVLKPDCDIMNLISAISVELGDLNDENRATIWSLHIESTTDYGVSMRI